MPYPNYLDEDELPLEDERRFVGPRAPRRPFDVSSIRREASRSMPDEPLPEAPDAPMPAIDSGPPPDFRRILGVGAREAPANPRQVASEEANANLAKVAGEQPVEGNPKWWQRLAAGAVGGLAGAVNSGGRVQVDDRAAVDNIYGGPGQRKRLSDWQGKVEGAEVQAKAAKGTLDSWRQGEDQERQMNLAEAAIDSHRASAERTRGMAEREQNQWKVDGKGRLYNTITGERKEEAPTPQTPEERFKLAKGLGVSDEDARVYALNSKVPEPKAARPEPTKIPGRDVPLSPEVEAQRKRMAGERSSGGGMFGSGGGASDDPKVIAQEIINGRQSPELTGLYGKGAAVRAELGRNKYDHATALTDWRAVQRHMATLNGTQQERLRQAVTFTYDSIDIIDSLYDEWKQVAGVSGIKVLNRANLAISKQLGGKAGEIATNLEAQINDLTSELGTVYKGGNSSTDESLRLAGENLKSDWNDATFRRATKQIRQNLQIRRNSINNSQPAGVSANSPYVRQQGGQDATLTAPPPGGPGDGPAVGTVKKGYRFKGGDPANQASWEKVK